MEILVGKTLLIVEDETDLREPLVTEFESLGCRVFQAKNGRDAFEIVKKETIDIVISDIRMPGGDGVELLNQIKAYDHQFPVVMLITGFSDLSREDAYHMGADALLSKPFDLDEIGATVVRVLTPQEQRWSTQFGREKIKKVINKTYETFMGAIEAGQFGMGRGGFFINETEGLFGRNERAAFRIRFEGGDILEFEGTGIVRWLRKEATDLVAAGCGIEFESLSESSREKITHLLKTVTIIPFIPKSGKIKVLSQ